jgi:stress response protein YsnF
MAKAREPALTIPVVNERAFIDKRVVEKGVVRVRTLVDEDTAWVREDLVSEEVVVDRVAIGREVKRPPKVRHEGDVMIIPVVEEVLVVEKRLVLKEELHVRRIASTLTVEETVPVRSMRAVVERYERGDRPEPEEAKPNPPEPMERRR